MNRRTDQDLLRATITNRSALVADINLAQHFLAVDDQNAGRDIALVVVWKRRASFKVLKDLPT
jgi:hypothetical protein